MKKFIAFILVLCLACSLELASADGFIIPEPLPDVPRPPAFSIKYHHVNVSVENQYARTEVDQVFLNYFYRDLEGTYIFPLPKEASISRFSMYVDGEELSGELLEKDEARRIYESIVRRLEDPALLEYMGRNMFRARVYPIPASKNGLPGEKRIALGYDELVSCESGICKYVYPLDTERFSEKPINSVLLTLRLKSDKPIKSVYSPTHAVSVDRISDFEVEVSYEEANARPDKDFELYYTISEEDFGLDLLTYKEDGKDGFFLLLLAPSYNAEQEVIPKDIVFVIDSSGSMAGEKIRQAKDALRFCVNNLNEEDRFNIVVFESVIEPFSNSLVSVDSRKEASDFIESIDSSGGTNINEALLSALGFMDDSSRQKVVVFLTDGLPTVDEVDPGRIRENVRDANDKGARIFVFGVGYDVNTHLLDGVSGDGSGVSTYVAPEEDIEVKVSSFYTKIQSPVLSGLKLGFSGVDAKEVYPRDLPDLFKGSQLVVVGRYSGSGKSKVSLQGDVAGRQEEFVYDVSFSPDSAENSFIPRLWATRKIGFLLDEIRLNGESGELIDEIVNLSLEYGIMSPYTSFLVDIDVPKPAHGVPTTTTFAMREMVAERLESSSFWASSGRNAVDSAQKTQDLKDSMVSEEEHEKVRYVGSKTFYLRGGSWVDSDFSADLPLTGIEYASEEYFELAAKDPEVGRYLSLGKNLSFCFEGACYQIGEGEVRSDPPSIPTASVPPKDSAMVDALLILGAVIILCAGVLAFTRFENGR